MTVGGVAQKNWYYGLSMVSSQISMEIPQSITSMVKMWFSKATNSLRLTLLGDQLTDQSEDFSVAEKIRSAPTLAFFLVGAISRVNMG